MQKKISLLLACIAVVTLLPAQRTKKPVTVDLFRDTPVLFNPANYPNGIVQKGEEIYLGNGRIVLKKVRIPAFRKYTEAALSITLVSNGDTWDKSGSCFVIPASGEITLLDIAAGRGAPTVPPSVDSTPPPVFGFRSVHKLLSAKKGKEK